MNAVLFTFFMWSKVMMLKLHLQEAKELPPGAIHACLQDGEPMLMLKLLVEETKMFISDMTVSMATTCTPAGRRRGHIRQTTYEGHTIIAVSAHKRAFPNK